MDQDLCSTLKQSHLDYMASKAAQHWVATSENLQWDGHFGHLPALTGDKDRWPVKLCSSCTLPRIKNIITEQRKVTVSPRSQIPRFRNIQQHPNLGLGDLSLDLPLKLLIIPSNSYVQSMSTKYSHSPKLLDSSMSAQAVTHDFTSFNSSRLRPLESIMTKSS